MSAAPGTLLAAWAQRAESSGGKRTLTAFTAQAPRGSTGLAGTVSVTWHSEGFLLTCQKAECCARSKLMPNFQLCLSVAWLAGGHQQGSGPVRHQCACPPQHAPPPFGAALERWLLIPNCSDRHVSFTAATSEATV